MDNVVGTCSICGGAVCVPSIWMGVIPPIPSCRSCGALKKQPHGPVIDMVPNETVTKISSPSKDVNEAIHDFIKREEEKNNKVYVLEEDPLHPLPVAIWGVLKID